MTVGHHLAGAIGGENRHVEAGRPVEGEDFFQVGMVGAKTAVLILHLDQDDGAAMGDLQRRELRPQLV